MTSFLSKFHRSKRACPGSRAGSATPPPPSRADTGLRRVSTTSATFLSPSGLPTVEAEEIVAFQPATEEVSQGLCHQTALGPLSLAFERVQLEPRQRKALYGAAEKLASSCIEANFANRSIQDWSFLRECIIEVYAKILQYTADVKAAADSYFPGRTAASSRALAKEPLQTLKEDIEELEATRERKKESQAISVEVQNVLTDMSFASDAVDKLLRMNTSENDDKIRDWFFKNPSSKLDIIQKDLAQYKERLETGEWFLQSEDFIMWKDYPQQNLSLTGTARCGKSYFCSTIIRHLFETYLTNCGKVIAYCFFDSAMTNLKTPFQTLIRQMLPRGQPILDYVYEFHELYSDYVPTADQFAPIFSKLLRTPERDIFLLLDRFECCAEPSNSLQNILSLVGEVLAEGYGHVHVFTTSRIEGALDRIVKASLKLHSLCRAMDVTRKLEEDMDRFTDYNHPPTIYV
ncbi:hypothetical protein K458DRAFT_387050 [Lentithecium fluviatile CBS 122367]|uniref:Nephrocystin 3-like N-terminal domain-containing protein n=1 Tax=Lentithecium fluviatile CBS 122367 TaxID=1168545 RepID=A0A6G1J738_9PLEO|nr:hypothetical protein K458DRAFT_387050 [Lentithecium fluviatile CBS 122367]